MFEQIWSGYLFETSELVWYLYINIATHKVMLKYSNPSNEGFELQMEVSEDWFIGALLCVLNKELPVLPSTRVTFRGKEASVYITHVGTVNPTTTGIVTKERQGVYMDNMGAQRLLDAILEWRKEENGKM